MFLLHVDVGKWKADPKFYDRQFLDEAKRSWERNKRDSLNRLEKVKTSAAISKYIALLNKANEETNKVCEVISALETKQNNSADAMSEHYAYATAV